MSVLIRRITDQTRALLSVVDGTDKLAGIAADGKYFGDASRITGILKPFDPETGEGVNVTGTDYSTATANAKLIQDALNAAATDPEIDTIKLPNAKVFCDRLTLGFVPAETSGEITRVDHSGLTIEGGGKTFVVNKYHPHGLGVIFASPYPIGYFDRIDEYQPGDPDQTEVRITSADPEVGLSEYAEGMLMYAFPRYYQQKIANSRDCQLNRIVSITPGSDEITVTLDQPLPTDLQATELKASVKTGGVAEVDIMHSYGALYERTFLPRVHFSGGGGSGAVAKAVIGSGAVTAINVGNPGSGYVSAPTVVITPAVGESGGGATATAYLNGMNQIDHINVDMGGSKYSAPPTISFTGGGGGTGATAEALIVETGLITSVEVMDPGTGYTTEPTVTIDPPPLFAKWVKSGGRVLSVGVDYVVMANPSDAALFPIDSYAWLCTGPAYDESDGRYFRVRNKISGPSGRVYFTEALRPEDYIEDQTCLIPGPFVENVTLRNVLCGGFEELFTGNWALNFQNCVNTTVENVQMLRGDESLVSGNMGAFRSQYMRIHNCLAHIENQCAHNLTVTDSVLGDYITHSHCTDTLFSHCKVSQYDGPFSALGSGTIRFTFRDCEFNFPTTRIVAPEGEELVFENCRVVNTSDDWSFDGPGIRFRDVNFETAAGGAITYSANCTDCILENVRVSATNSVGFDSASTGYYQNVSAEQSPPAGWRVAIRLLKMQEIVDPNSPSTDTGALYVADNSGKSELRVRFHMGSPIVIATEP